MDIKSKNKSTSLLIFILIVYSLSISAFAAFDINNNMDLLTWDPNDQGPSRMSQDYQYYNAIRQRVIKEIPILIVALIIGVGLMAYGIKEYKLQEYLEKPLSIYRKIPLDFRTGIFIVYSFFTLAFLENMQVFYKPIGIGHFITISFVSLYIAYFFLNVLDAYKMISISGYLRNQFKKSIIYIMIASLIGSFAVKSVGIKILIITILTAFTGFFFMLFFIGWRGSEFLFFFSGLYMILYLIFVPYYVIKHVSQLNKIIIGAEEISTGNLNYTIEENGKGHLSRLANNINNMGAGYKNSVKNQLKSERLKTELITNVSHDLKTPLTSIINYIDLLKKESTSVEEVKDYIEILDRKSQRLKTLIDDLFEASKMTSGSIELDIEILDVVELLKQSLGEYDERIKNSPLDFIMNIPEHQVYANLDGKKTWRVFENLISNILKYSMENTRVYIDIGENENYAVVTMKNISSHQLDFDSNELFERFIRGDKSRTTEGSGLGLAIAKSIVELQGGKLDIEIDGDLFKAIVYFKK